MQSLVDWIRAVGLENAWVYSAFIVIFVTLSVNYLAVMLMTKIEYHLAETHNAWDDALVISIRKPLTTLIWVIGFSYVLRFVEKETQSGFFTRVDDIARLSVVVLIGWFLFRLAKEVERNLLNPKSAENKMDETSVSVVARLVRASVVITTGLVVMQAMGYSISGVLAFGGIGGIAIGFAAKETLANFFGAMMIYMDKPFRIGDWIRSPDKDIEGTVVSIGWRVTVIRTFKKRTLHVPNATFITISVENCKMQHRRIKETIGIRYDDISKIGKIIEDVKKMLRAHKEIAQDQTMIVNLNTFSASSVDFFIYTFTKTGEWVKYHEVKQDVLLKIGEIVEQNEAEMAFPTSTIHMANDGSEFAQLKLQPKEA